MQDVRGVMAAEIPPYKEHQQQRLQLQQQQWEQQTHSLHQQPQQSCVLIQEGGGGDALETHQLYSPPVLENVESQPVVGQPPVDVQASREEPKDGTEQLEFGITQQDMSVNLSQVGEQPRGQSHTSAHTHTHQQQQNTQEDIQLHPASTQDSIDTTTTTIPLPVQIQQQSTSISQFPEAVLTIDAGRRKISRRTEDKFTTPPINIPADDTSLEVHFTREPEHHLNGHIQGVDLNEIAPVLIKDLHEGRRSKKDVEEWLLLNSGAESISQLMDWNNNSHQNGGINIQPNQLQQLPRLPPTAIIEKNIQRHYPYNHAYNQQNYGGHGGGHGHHHHHPQNGRREGSGGYTKGGGGMRRSHSRENMQQRKNSMHGNKNSQQHVVHQMGGLSSSQQMQQSHQQQQYRGRQQQSYQMQHQHQQQQQQQQQIGGYRHKSSSRRGEQQQQQHQQQYHQQQQQQQQNSQVGEEQFRQAIQKQVLEQGPNATMDIERFLIQIMPSIKVKRTKGKNVVEAVSDIKLSELWEFYHLPSFYGREVFTQGGSRGASLAYYVPYLSAVQLYVSTSPKDPGVDSIYMCEEPPEGFSRNMHLLFEYFEKESPHNRCPMYLQLQRIANGQHEDFPTPVHEIMTQKISTLHPASWFAVAWYPLYRIPDSSLTGRFLTYHSLIQAVGTIKQMEQNAETVLSQPALWPVIFLQPNGLKYYNLTSEKWFGTEDSQRASESLSQSGCSSVSDMDPAMRHSFEKLELVAEKFATGDGIKKVGQSGVEHRKQEHPDFKFFSSRQ